MKRIAIALAALLALPAAAAEAPAAQDPMAVWKPPTVKNEAKDRKEIQAVLREMETAGMKGDLDAVVALVDFPVLMVTDDSKGRALAESWDREKWIEVMKPFYKPMPDMKVKHQPTIFLLSDSLATVGDVATMTMGKKKITTRNSLLLVRVDGRWRVKSMVEGGWGDMMAEGAHASGGQQQPQK